MIIKIYDRGGRLVDEMRVGDGITQGADGNTATWFGLTGGGRSIASGVYTIVVSSSFGSRIIRMTIVK